MKLYSCSIFLSEGDVEPLTPEERIIKLVRPYLMDCIPSFIKEHAAEKACRQIEREFPDLYEAFSRETEPDEELQQRMAVIVNDIIGKQNARRNMRQQIKQVPPEDGSSVI